MSIERRDLLRDIRTFPSLIKYLRYELDWPIQTDDFEDLTFDYTPEELGIDSANAVKIHDIKRLRPLATNQPWGIFFVKFEPKRLPVVALRRILSRVVVKKRASANSAERTSWEMNDLLFISNYGEGEERKISLAHFSQDEAKNDLPTLKVLGWDNLDTALHLDRVYDNVSSLTWPDDEDDSDAWRREWRSAFTLRHREVITTSKTLAVKLAELARDIRTRIRTVLSIETQNGPVTKIMKAFQEALIHDLDEDSFADMYAQTIAYGLLSARITHPTSASADSFAEQIPITNPFLKELLETFLNAGGRNENRGAGGGIDFDEMGVAEVVELLDDANMEAVVIDFGDRNPEEDPVIHFYELFLKEYDAKKRMDRGVFYTPRPVVSFIVRSVDELLREEFNLSDGLADTTTWGEMVKRNSELKIPKYTKAEDAFVQILDPATGTGTFLVEVIDVIYNTMTDRWRKEGRMELELNGLWNDYVPQHLLPRLHGYELLMAPYAIAHMKIGLKLYETGYRFESDERARVYLTNALEPAQDFSGTLAFAIPALAHEAEAVNKIKQEQPFTVVIGNPPYARHSSNPSKSSDGEYTFIGRLIEDYRFGCPELYKPAQAKYLQDDYVKFIRFAEWCIAQANHGVLGFITNHGFLDNPTFRGMRQHLKANFSRLELLDLHGNTKKKEVTSHGGIDENVFDIQQGVSITCGVMLAQERESVTVQKSDAWGSRADKYAFLSGSSSVGSNWEKLPSFSPLHLFTAQNEGIRHEYEFFPTLPQLFSINGDPAPGVVTTHDQFAIAFTEDEIIRNVESLLQTETEDEARSLFRLCTQDQWNYEDAKNELRSGEWRNEVGRILYRPFDVRWTVYHRRVAVHRRERVSRHMRAIENVALISARANRSPSMDHFFCSRFPSETKCGESTIQSCIMPLYLVRDHGYQKLVFDDNNQPICNISDDMLRRLSSVLDNFENPDPELGFNYVYAVLHSPTYRSRYAEFLKLEFPRVPLPSSQDLFEALSQSGRSLVNLHLMESPKLGVIITYAVGTGDFQVEKVSYSDETVWIDKAKTRGFKGVPEEVWNFHIGGYQVCHKWLKDRGPKKGNPGRILTDEDIKHYQKIVVALNETIRIMKEIDEVIEEHGGWPDAFQKA